MGYSFQKIGNGQYRVNGVRISPRTGRYITESSRRKKRESAVHSVDYRLRVIAGFDTANGVKKGESFYPFIHPVHDRERLAVAAVTWDSMGHESIIESRTVTMTYGEWERENE